MDIAICRKSDEKCSEELPGEIDKILKATKRKNACVMPVFSGVPHGRNRAMSERMEIIYALCFV